MIRHYSLSCSRRPCAVLKSVPNARASVLARWLRSSVENCSGPERGLCPSTMTEGAALEVPGDRTWNICMLAHVDHGKSALSDCLISANGIISNRMAGKVRYMDSRADEQLRGITMKSSSIALGHRFSENGPLSIVHLVDSPGHVDFTGEVEAALRVCDGAILVVDVVEGVCVQTVTVLRAALAHAVRPVLVLNKIDRLFVELSLSPMEAYRHIQMVIEQVNVIMGVREVEQMMEEAALGDDAPDQAGSDWTLDESAAKGERTESGFFSPELGNVAFASAVDGWAFRITDFAKIFSKRFGISERVLERTLWGDYYLQQKAKRIVRKKTSDVAAKAEPMFSKFIMTSIHAVYDGVLSTQNDPELALKKRTHIAEKLGLKLSKRDLKHRDTSVVLHAIMGSWLPAARVLLDMVAEKLPTAVQAQANKERLAVVWPHHAGSITIACDDDGQDCLTQRKESFARQHQALKDCSSAQGVPVIAVVTKMIEGPSTDAGSAMDIRQPRPREEMPSSKINTNVSAETEDTSRPKRKVQVEESRELIAFAKVLCGTVKVGMRLFVYGPKYKVAADGTFDKSTVSEATVTKLYLLMGRSTDNLRSVSAGSIVGIGGVDDVVLKTATLSSEPPGLCLPVGISLVGTGLQRDAVVRVAVEPHLPTQLPVLQAGLRKLNQSDPSVETMVTSSGEYVVAASGELHLERCLKDLREKFAKGISIHVSKPIASFRETVLGGASAFIDDENEEKRRSVAINENKAEDEGESQVQRNLETAKQSPFLENGFIQFGRFVTVSNSEFSFRVFASPIPTHLSSALDDAGATVRAITQGKDLDMSACRTVREKIEEAVKKDAEGVKSSKVSAEDFESFWLRKIFPCVWACGPRRFGSNLLVGPHPSSSVLDHLKHIFVTSENISLDAEKAENRMRELENAIATGFQLGVQAGPLAEEPMHGVAIFIDDILLKSNASQAPVLTTFVEEQSPAPTSHEKSQSGNVSGLAIGAMKEGTRRALLQANARLMEAVLHVDISVTSDALGGTYTVIGKRRGRVLDEQMRDGVNIFGIEALIPVVESFGFADLVRKQTSGFAVPQMVFSHWETIEIDPFWEPRTEEELEDLGVSDATAENNNLARKLMNSVRRRKGLKVEEKIVEKAEKQRTLSRKK